MNLWIDGRANHWRARKIVREKDGGSSGERERKGRGGQGNFYNQESSSLYVM